MGSVHGVAKSQTRLSMSTFIYLSVPGLSSNMQDFFFFNCDVRTLSCNVENSILCP